jgi:hypothetical protein
MLSAKNFAKAKGKINQKERFDARNLFGALGAR